jgi:hypothetical protein
MGIKLLVKNTLSGILRWAESAENEANMICNQKPQAVGQFDNQHTGVSFTIYSAAGGKVVSIRKFDSKIHEWASKLYIIPDGGDLGQELSHIMTVDTLAR